MSKQEYLDYDGPSILALPMQENSAGAATVRDYLKALLQALWRQGGALAASGHSATTVGGASLSLRSSSPASSKAPSTKTILIFPKWKSPTTNVATRLFVLQSRCFDELHQERGGQNGADQAGLRAAVKAGLPTGGYAPKGWRTADGPRPDLASYGLIETTARNYLVRTELNVKESDATIRFASDWNSAGEKWTLRYVNQNRKPHFDVTIDANGSCDKFPALFASWLHANNVKVLNVAGNAEGTSPGIGRIVETFLTDAFMFYLA